MGSIHILKPLSTFLQPVPLINLGNIDNFPSEIFLGNARNQTWGGWVQSKYATSVLSCPLQDGFFGSHHHHILWLQEAELAAIEAAEKEKEEEEEKKRREEEGIFDDEDNIINNNNINLDKNEDVDMGGYRDHDGFYNDGLQGQQQRDQMSRPPMRSKITPRQYLEQSSKGSFLITVYLELFTKDSLVRTVN